MIRNATRLIFPHSVPFPYHTGNQTGVKRYIDQRDLFPYSVLSPDVQTPPPVPEEGEGSGAHNSSEREGNPTEVHGDIPVLSTAAQEVSQHRIASGADYRYATPPRLTAEGQDMRSAMFKSSSAAHSRSHGVPVPSSAGQIPSIQVRGVGGGIKSEIWKGQSTGEKEK